MTTNKKDTPSPTVPSPQRAKSMEIGNLIPAAPILRRSRTNHDRQSTADKEKSFHRHYPAASLVCDVVPVAMPIAIQSETF
jgi:hypothetical protein